MRSYHQYPKCGQTVLDCEECSCTAAPAPLPEEEAFTPVFDAVQRMYREGFSGDAETIQRYITDLTRRLAEAEARPLIPAGAKVTIHTPPMPESELVSHLQRQIVALHKEIHRLREAAELRAAGIGANVHYIPVHLHPYYRRCFGLTGWKLKALRSAREPQGRPVSAAPRAWQASATRIRPRRRQISRKAP